MQHLTSKAGEFRAVCRLKRRVRWDRMTEELWVIANERGYVREFVEVESERKDKETGKHGRWLVAFAACEGFETTDRVAFERHIAEVHDGGPMRWDSGGLVPTYSTTKTYSPRMTIPVRMWKGPKAPTEQRPLVTKVDVEQCGSCGLVADLNGSQATELWWSEHQRGCALAQAGVAS